MPLKTCPKCQKQHGPRTQECDCGFVFQKGKPKTKEPQEKRITYAQGPGMILAAAGTPPYTPANVSPDAIEDWVNKCQKDSDHRLTEGALRGWLHYIYPPYILQDRVVPNPASKEAIHWLHLVYNAAPQEPQEELPPLPASSVNWDAKKKAEYLLNNAIDQEDYQYIRRVVQNNLKIDPDSVPHMKPD